MDDACKEGDIIVTLDSDTLLHKKAIINLMKPFSDPKTGAATGQLEVLNEKKLSQGVHMELLVGKGKWQGFILSGGLP